MKRALIKAACLAVLLCTGAVQAQTWVDRNVGDGQKFTGWYTDNGDGTSSITGSGWDIWGGWDGYFYHYTSITGVVWDVSVRIRDLTGPDNWTKCELMAHWQTPQYEEWRLPNYPFIGAMTTRTAGANTVKGAWRPQIGWNCQDKDPSSTPTYPNQWLRLSRRGPVFSMYRSTDGLTWTHVTDWNTSQTADNLSGTYWPENLFIGMAVTAHNNDDATGATATYSDWSIVEGTITPPTTITTTVQPTNTTVYAGREASFYCDTRNDAVPTPPWYYTAYQWYRDGVQIPGATARTLTFLTTTNDNNAKFYCQATCAGVSGLTATGTLAVLPGTVYAGALRTEMFWSGPSRADVEAGAVGPGQILACTALDYPNNVGDSYGRRVSGYFIAPQTGNYDFFINSDDDSDLFLSQDMNPANKQLIARETGWSNPRAWTTSGNVTEKRTTTFGGGVFSAGIYLEQGKYYYIEAVHREGGGGDNLSVYYKLTTDLVDPVDGTPGNICTASNNVAVMTSPVTYLNWVTQPVSSNGIPDGQTLALSATATSDCEFPVAYQWLRGGVPIANATGTALTMTVTPNDNNAQFALKASTPVGGLSITSTVSTLKVLSSIFEPGWARVEVWNGLTDRAAVENGSAGLPSYTTTSPEFAANTNNANIRNDLIRKVSGFFIPPLTTNYVFYICSDDDSILYLSTNNTPAGKQKIAEQTDWADPFKWVSGGNTLQKCSLNYSPDGGLSWPGASGYALVAGQKYYMEAVHKQGSGGDNVEVTYVVFDGSTQYPYPTDGDDTAMKGAVIALSAPRSTVAITQQPASIAAPADTYAYFTVGASTDSTLPVGEAGPLVLNRFLMYQWQRGGIDIPGATGSAYSLFVTPADNGATFSCRVRSLGLADNSLNPVWTNTTSASLTVQGVYEPGYVKVEFWAPQYNKDGVLNNTAGLPWYVTTSPAFEANSDGGGDPPNGINDYARRVSGYFVAPADGTYDFFVTSDDDSNVYLSTDRSALNKQLICQEVGWSGGSRQWQTAGGTGAPLSQRRSDTWSPDGGATVPWAAGITLTQGEVRYIEAVQHEGGGGDYVQVTFVRRGVDAVPANGDLSRMTGTAIACMVPKANMVAFTLQPTNVTVNGPVVVNFYAQGITDSKISVGVVDKPVTNEFMIYQWTKNGVAIPGATKSHLAYAVTSPADQGVPFVCSMRAIGYADSANNPTWSNSLPATITIDDPSTPAIVYASHFTDLNLQPNVQIVDILFNKRMDAATLANIGSYVISGMSVTAVQVRTNDYKSVRLTVTGIPGTPFNVTVTGLQDYQGKTLSGSAASAVVNGVPLISQDIGFSRGAGTNDPQFPSTFWVDGPRAYTISAQGSDIWGTNDGFNLTYEMKTGDFDVAVRQLYITKSSTWAKGGLMARETLNPSSRHWTLVNTPASADGIQAVDNSGTGANQVSCQARSTFGGNGYEWNAGDPSVPPPAYPNAWVRLKRSGNVMRAYSSTNGVEWVLRGMQDATQTGSSNNLPQTMYVGICTTAHNNDDPYAVWQKFWNTSGYADYQNVTVAQPVVHAAVLGNNVQVSWTPANGKLQSTTALGPSAVWSDVPGGTSSPVTLPMTAGPVFFRVSLQ